MRPGGLARLRWWAADRERRRREAKPWRAAAGSVTAAGRSSRAVASVGTATQAMACVTDEDHGATPASSRAPARRAPPPSLRKDRADVSRQPEGGRIEDARMDESIVVPVRISGADRSSREAVRDELVRCIAQFGSSSNSPSGDPVHVYIDSGADDDANSLAP